VIRRRLCLVLVAVATLVLAACGGGGTSSSGPTEIAVWHGYQDTEGDAFGFEVSGYLATVEVEDHDRAREYIGGRKRWAARDVAREHQFCL